MAVVQTACNQGWNDSTAADARETKTHNLFLPELFLFLLQKDGGNAARVLLGTDQQVPQFLHEQTCILTVEKASQIELHLLWIRKLEGEEKRWQQLPLG